MTHFSINSIVFALVTDEGKVTYGEKGTVLGYGNEEGPVRVRFPKGVFNCSAEVISKDCPLPKGYSIGDKVFVLVNDEGKVTYGEEGAVLGYGNKEGPVRVRFPKGIFNCSAEVISKVCPLPKGYSIGDKVFVLVNDAGRVTCGEEGAVLGYGNKEGPVRVRFPNGVFNCSAEVISKDCPLPKGYSIGDKVFVLVDDEGKFTYGEEGSVLGYGSKEGPVRVRFPKGDFNCNVNAISTKRPTPAYSMEDVLFPWVNDSLAPAWPGETSDSDRCRVVGGNDVRELFHCTSLSNAQSILHQKMFRPGAHGFIGPGIYFSETPEMARRYCQCRSGYGHRVVIRCRVNVGRMKAAYKGEVCSVNDLIANRCDSFKEVGRDCIMLPNMDKQQMFVHDMSIL